MLSLKFLDAASELKGVSKPTFYTLCEAVLPCSGRVVDFAVVLNCFGTSCAYLIVVGDSFTQALSGLGIMRQAWILGGVAFVTPLCFMRSMDALRVTSLLAVL